MKARAAHAEREIGVGWQGGKETWRSEAAKKGVRVDFFSSNQGLRLRETVTHAFISLSQSETLAATPPTLADLCNSVDSCFRKPKPHKPGLHFCNSELRLSGCLIRKQRPGMLPRETYFETSAKQGCHVDDAFQCIAKNALKNEPEEEMYTLMGKRWLKSEETW
ncbi:unnamed protein product [Malus baccata var. baccata]